jgi:hypothetical protein
MVRGLQPHPIMLPRGLASWFLAALLAAGCATVSHRAPREKDSAAERLAALREATPELKAAAVEERFSAEEDRERREQERAARAERQHRLELIEKEKAKKQAPAK